MIKARVPNLHWILLLLFALSCGEMRSPAQPASPAARTAASIGPLAQPVAGQGADSSRHAAEPGELQAEPPTVQSLALRWPVRGDVNANASIVVQFRKTGTARWQEAYALFRIHPSKVSPENRVADGWLFAGSIVELDADTEYEVRLTLIDPEGGSVERKLSLRTLHEPRQPEEMRIRHVVSGADDGGSGSRENPFRGLRTAQAAAQPGDLFLVHSGIYNAGDWVIDKHGAPNRPIIYRGADDGGEVILDGAGKERLISAAGARHIWFENLTLRNARYLLVAHNASHLVIRGSRFLASEVGIAAINGGYERSRHFFIVDNVFTGPASWPRSKGIEPSYAISVTGAGHVIAYNRIAGFGDGIHGSSHGRLASSDIYNNEVVGCTDDGIEADYSDTNVRIFRNRITNCFAAISAQPVNGGPLYVFRNAMYNLQYAPFKLHNDTSGILLFHNTSLLNGTAFQIQPGRETVNDVTSRNNLFFGTKGPALHSTGVMIRCDFDNDGYGGFTGPFALWNDRTYPSPQAARSSRSLYKRQGAFLIDVQGAFASSVLPPSDLRRNYPVQINDLRLRAGSRAIDRGILLANFNDGFLGRAPDLGCCEFDLPLPHYGPRPLPKP
ncbi:MAG: right-handed parallel beta-helix repeat-containing protein [Candidatus Binatia bacterium]